jgi:hypothetical protein|nr:MAG TPA: hypothetical protein [Caudoviricetes sp.]DAV26442.1 MAG TPA: hypothetical protein [Caudoviricetes sp.]
MAKKETKKPQDTSVTEVAEEVVETPVEEEVEEVVEPVAEPEVVEETPVEAPVEGVDKNSVTEEEYLMVGYEDYTGKFTPDVDGRLIELIVPDGMAGRVTTLLGEYDLIITINEDGRFTVGPFSGDKFNEAVRLVAGCGVMYRI